MSELSGGVGGVSCGEDGTDGDDGMEDDAVFNSVWREDANDVPFLETTKEKTAGTGMDL